MDYTQQRPKFCGAPTKDGDVCRKPPVAWQMRCELHGGKTPLGKRHAEEMKLAARDIAFARLMDAVKGGGRCEHCGRSDDMNVVVRAAVAVLDRTGWGPSSTLNLQPKSPREEFEGMRTEQLAAEAEQIVRALREPRPVLDGEVVGTSGESNFPDREMPEAPATEPDSNG